jgi:hypothetical protein
MSNEATEIHVNVNVKFTVHLPEKANQYYERFQLLDGQLRRIGGRQFMADESQLADFVDACESMINVMRRIRACDRDGD